jgi:hypothetical protein
MDKSSHLRRHRKRSAPLRIFAARRFPRFNRTLQSDNPAASDPTVSQIPVLGRSCWFQDIRQQATDVSTNRSACDLNPPIWVTLILRPVPGVYGTSSSTYEFVSFSIRHTPSTLKADYHAARSEYKANSRNMLPGEGRKRVLLIAAAFLPPGNWRSAREGPEFLLRSAPSRTGFDGRR